MTRKEINDVNSCINNINNTEEKITYFKDKINKSKEKKIYKTLNTFLESVDTIVITGATSTSKTLSVTGVGLIFFTIVSWICVYLIIR